MENPVMLAALAALIALSAYLALRKPAWSGVRSKTAWDWIALLLVPSMVGFGTFLISASQARVESQRQQEVALQQYYDRISNLALSDAGMTQTAVVVGRAHTATILSLVDGDRAGRVLLFLNELGALELFVDSLENRNFAEAELKNFSLNGMEYEGSDFQGADLEDGSFRNSDFEDTNLRWADLDGADLRGSDFEGADMKGVELAGTDLRGADLSAALNLKNAMLDDACMDETTRLPSGFSQPTNQTKGCFGDNDRDSDDD